MKKAMIVQPMNGLGEEQILEARASQSLVKMAECDVVYLCDDWENARGCKVERAAAVAYDLELIGYDLPCRGDAS